MIVRLYWSLLSCQEAEGREKDGKRFNCWRSPHKSWSCIEIQLFDFPHLQQTWTSWCSVLVESAPAFMVIPWKRYEWTGWPTQFPIPSLKQSFCLPAVGRGSNRWLCQAKGPDVLPSQCSYASGSVHSSLKGRPVTAGSSVSPVHGHVSKKRRGGEKRGDIGKKWKICTFDQVLICTGHVCDPRKRS